ncbi:G-protein alpha subunit-domain-containing protein [Xylariaceae sp. FL0804]|nr:G-protein alpha subunit-domain-containing protein [Xylariaceae sp. FL0804]
MDPISLVGLVGSVTALGAAVVKCIAGLSSLKSRYHDAPLVVSTIIGQLYMVKAALDHLAAWKSPQYDRDPRYRQLALQIENSLDSFGLLILALEQKLDSFSNSEQMTASSRVMFLWDKDETTEFSALLDRQVNALNLLLQAVRCKTWDQQQEFVAREESRSILCQARECSSSILALGDTASVVSKNTDRVSIKFDFDAIILNSRIYRQAGISHMRQAIRAERTEPPNRGQLHMASSQDATFPSYLPDDEGKGKRKSASASLYLLETETPWTEKLEPQATMTQQGQDRDMDPSPNTEYPAADTASHNAGSAPRFRPNRLADWWRRKPLPRLPNYSQRSQLDPANVLSTMTAPKVLLLGASGSGKSTLMRAFKLALEGDHTDEERLKFLPVIYTGLITSVRIVLDEMKSFGIPLELETNNCHVQTLLTRSLILDERVPPPTEVISALSALWNDGGFQSTYDRRRDYKLPDNFHYYITSIERMTTQGYIPSEEDILRASSKTMDLIESVFHWPEPAPWRIIDVPVAITRSDLRMTEWAYASKDATTVLCTIDMTACSDILRGGYENSTSKRLHWFQELVRFPCFTHTSFVLVFTKMDLLEAELRAHPPDRYPKNFTPRDDESPAGLVEHLMWQLECLFLSSVLSEDKRSRIQTVRANLVDADNSKHLVLNLLDMARQGYISEMCAAQRNRQAI